MENAQRWRAGLHRRTTLANSKVSMYYMGVQEYKPLHEAPRRLADCEEARGQLLRIFTAEEMCIATFEWGVMGLPLEIGEELKLLVGREIAILRLEGRFYVRGVDNA